MKPVRARRRHRNRESRNYFQYWTSLLVVCHNHCCARSNFRFTTRVRLRHVRRSAHLGHVLAAFHLWSCHRCVGDHARQQRRSSPADHQEDDGYSGETSHGCESRPTVSRTQVIPITVIPIRVLSDLGLPTPTRKTQYRYPKAVFTKPSTQANDTDAGTYPTGEICTFAGSIRGRRAHSCVNAINVVV